MWRCREQWCGRPDGHRRDHDRRARSDEPSAATASSTAAKASANNASAAQLQAAFEAGGVPNASRWVIEVQEYRPYPVDDPTFAKLKSNLAKYNPSAETLSRILAALSLP